MQNPRKKSGRVLETPSTELLDRYRAGDEQAADELFRRYLGRLTVFARARLSSRIARRIDAEDVVQSAYRSFFLRARDGRLALERSGDLWRLLVAITLNKLHRTVAHHQAARRSVRLEQVADLRELVESSEHVGAATAEEGLALAEVLEGFLTGLGSRERTILEMRLRDCSVPEIAAATSRSERSVRRILSELEQQLQRQLREPRN